MSHLPAEGYISDAGRTTAEMKQALEDLRDGIANGFGNAAMVELTIDTGSVTPTQAAHSIDTESDAGTDDLTHMDQTNMPDGAIVLIRSEDNARNVVVKHGSGGAGQILLADAVDMTLNGTTQWLMLQRFGTSWSEILRSYGSDKAAFRTHLGLGTAAIVDTGFTSGLIPTLEADGGLTLKDTDVGSSLGPGLRLWRDSFSPAINDFIGFITFDGENDVSDRIEYAGIRARILDPESAPAAGELYLRALVPGAGATTVITIANGVKVGAPTGSYKGLETLNAVEVYDDGVLLTCYVIEAWQDGQIDQTKWDDHTPNLDVEEETEQVDTGVLDAKGNKIFNRVVVKEAYTKINTHGPAARFAAVAAERLDIDAFTDFLKTNQHLPAMPSPTEWNAADKKMSTGDMLQRLWETVETQAVHIAKLNDRLKALEA